ncbi:alpha/beta fold hydrolase [Escherichia coli]|uniref:alpha/beta fold hydrolase n=1 Tax=Escherichia coli TaxID=562 RepID=UPI003FD5B5AF
MSNNIETIDMKTQNKLSFSENGPYNNKHGFPPIFFLYNTTLGENFFERQISFFSYRYRTFSVSISNDTCGDTTCSHTENDLKHHGNRIIALADSMNIRKFIICCVSESSNIALSTGAIHHDRVCGIILIGASFLDKKKINIENPQPIKTITQPVLLLYGEHENGSITCPSEKINSKIKHSRVVMIPDGGKPVNRKQYSFTNNVIQYWLSDYFC